MPTKPSALTGYNYCGSNPMMIINMKSLMEEVHKSALFNTSVGAQLVNDIEVGTGPIFLDRVSCSGSEMTLLECTHAAAPVGIHSCDHSSDVGISCQGKIFSIPCGDLECHIASA